MTTVRKKLIGHYNYYGITDNIKGIYDYKYAINKLLYKWLNRRSQKKSYTYDGFNIMVKLFNLPVPKIKVNIYAIWWITTILWRAVCGKSARTVPKGG